MKARVGDQKFLSSLIKEHRAHRTQEELQSSSASWFEKKLKRPRNGDDEGEDDDEKGEDEGVGVGM